MSDFFIKNDFQAVKILLALSRMDEKLYANLCPRLDNQQDRQTLRPLWELKREQIEILEGTGLQFPQKTYPESWIFSRDDFSMGQVIKTEDDFINFHEKAVHREWKINKIYGFVKKNTEDQALSDICDDYMEESGKSLALLRSRMDLQDLMS